MITKLLPKSLMHQYQHKGVDLPDDLDYQWYINEAISKMKDLGVNYGS